MTTKTGQIFGNICISCVVIALVIIAVVTAATLLWVGYLG